MPSRLERATRDRPVGKFVARANWLGPYGLQLDPPSAAPSPDVAIVRNLLSMSTRIVPRSP